MPCIAFFYNYLRTFVLQYSQIFFLRSVYGWHTCSLINIADKNCAPPKMRQIHVHVSLDILKEMSYFKERPSFRLCSWTFIMRTLNLPRYAMHIITNVILSIVFLDLNKHSKCT